MASVHVFLIAFLSVKERVQPDISQRTSLKNDLQDLINNKPWIILATVSVITLIYVAIRSAVIMYYFKYYITNVAAAGPFMVTGTLAVMLGVIPTKWLTSKIGKKRLYILSMIIVALSSAGFFIAGPEDIVWIYAMQIIFSFASGPSMPLLWSMLADAADYSEWKNGRRATGLVYSAATFSQKMGFSIGGAVFMFILSIFGYVADAPQTAESILGIKLSLSLIPAGIAALAIFALLFYQLDDKRVAEIGDELAKRKLQAI